MYFSSLEKLKDSEIPIDQLEILDRFLARNWSTDQRVLGATLLARTEGLAFEDAVELLLQAARVNVVALKYRLGCPVCGHTVESYDNLNDLSKQPKECGVCFEQFDPSSDDIWVYFQITSEPIGDLEIVKKKR